jgi:demethylmenaquinone methyltransferase/2-methoxy-6-polyprenyl-1,4-benzoquinol methylase
MGQDGTDRELLASQVNYYRLRAAEYDVSSYGDDLEAARVGLAKVLDQLASQGSVLEIACGTGMWTQELAVRAHRLLAIDSAPEALELARQRVRRGDVTLQVADVFAWEPELKFDTVFMGFWLSHVPRARWKEFVERVGAWLHPGGRLLVVDEHIDRRPMEKFDPSGVDTAVRRTSDGREHRLVKVYLDPAELEDLFTELGWPSQITVEKGWVALSATRS